MQFKNTLKSFDKRTIGMFGTEWHAPLASLATHVAKPSENASMPDSNESSDSLSISYDSPGSASTSSTGGSPAGWAQQSPPPHAQFLDTPYASDAASPDIREFYDTLSRRQDPFLHYCMLEKCGKSFTRMSCLKRHSTSVHGFGPSIYKCATVGCHFVCVRKDKMQHHLRVKQHSCDLVALDTHINPQGREAMMELRKKKIRLMDRRAERKQRQMA